MTASTSGTSESGAGDGRRGQRSVPDSPHAERGEDWNRIGRLLPPAQAGEAAFAASGTCLETVGTDHAWIATGAAATARILATTDGGQTWKSYATPIQPQGTPVSGLTTVAFRDTRHGIIAGGDVVATDREPHNVAVSDDGGKTWDLVDGTPFPGAAYGLSYVGAEDGDFVRTVVITGPGGAAWSRNEGNSWHRLPGIEGFWAVGFADPQHGWLVGDRGADHQGQLLRGGQSLTLSSRAKRGIFSAGSTRRSLASLGMTRRDSFRLDTCPYPSFGISSVIESRAAHTCSRRHVE